MNVKQKPLAELTEEALQILYRELGTVNTVRFLRQFSTGFGNYTAERAARGEEETLDELLDEIKARRTDNQSPKKINALHDTSYQQRIDKIRRRYPRAYEKWTAEEDAQLRQKYQAGLRVNELAKFLARQSGAVASRLRKLGLIT
jgi:hypothetical protein